VKSNSLTAIDPFGLDIIVITGGVRDGSANVFGHTAGAVQGFGMASYGNDTNLGSSVRDYISRESSSRMQTVTIIPTTPFQDRLAQAFIEANPDTNDIGLLRNCAVMTNGLLNAAGVRTRGIPFPGGLARDVQSIPGSTTFVIPQNGFIPAPLSNTLLKF
jgi:hypothetical protein